MVGKLVSSFYFKSGYILYMRLCSDFSINKCDHQSPKHNSFDVLSSSYNNNTRIEIFRHINTILVISFLSHVLRDIEFILYSKEIY